MSRHWCPCCAGVELEVGSSPAPLSRPRRYDEPLCHELVEKRIGQSLVEMDPETFEVPGVLESAAGSRVARRSGAVAGPSSGFRSRPLVRGCRPVAYCQSCPSLHCTDRNRPDLFTELANSLYRT